LQAKNSRNIVNIPSGLALWNSGTVCASKAYIADAEFRGDDTSLNVTARLNSAFVTFHEVRFSSAF
jgi:hypothetical protein